MLQLIALMRNQRYGYKYFCLGILILSFLFQNVQRRHLFHNETSDNHNATNALYQVSPFQDSLIKNKKTKDDIKVADLISLLKKPSSQFIYPEPVFINLNGKTKELNSTKHFKRTEICETVLEEESVSSPVVTQQRRRNSKESRKSLNFSNEIVGENSSCDSFGDSSQNATSADQHVFNVEPSLANFEAQYLNEALFTTKSNFGGAKSFKTIETRSSEICIEMGPSSDKQHAMISQSVLDSIGFKTAKGNKIPITEKAMDKAKAMLEITEADLMTTKVQDPISSANSPNHGTAFLQRFESSKTPETKGFITASGKTLRVSDESAARAKAMFDEVNEHLPSSEQPKTVGFSTASGKNVVLSEKGMAKAKSFLSEFEQDFVPPKEVLQVAGFSMASGKKVIVSEEAMFQAHTLLEDINSKCTPDSEEIKAMTEKCTGISKLKLCPSNPPKAANGSFRVPKFTNGFSTTNGKKVQIFEDAMIPTKHTLIDEEHLPENKTRPNGFEFSTASGKHVTVSEMAMSKAGKLFHEIESMDCSPVEVPNISGFNLASGKNIKISESALSRSRKLFDEFSEKDNLNNIIESGEPPFPVKDIHGCIDSEFSMAVTDEKTDRKIQVEEEDNWVSSPTIGKKKRKNLSPSPRTKGALTPISGTPSAFENAPTSVSAKVLAMRRKARQEQKFVIQSKRMKGRKTSPRAGYLSQIKKDATRKTKTWRELVGNSKLPEMCAPYQLLQDHQMLPSVCLVQASNASSFNFFAWEHFPIEDCRQNVQGFQLGKSYSKRETKNLFLNIIFLFFIVSGEFLVILSDDNTIGCEEIGASLLASKNVDPSLCSLEWIRNHFRWIVWKLASMEIRCPTLFARACLTPSNVLEQLKYRYDREIDNSQRSALKRIIEQVYLHL